MCGRFYIDDDLKDRLDKLLKEMDNGRALRQKRASFSNSKKSEVICSGEVFPSNQAAILYKELVNVELVKWGYPSWKSKSVIFNARSETVLQKRMFEKGFVENRCIIPVSGFYEWDSHKTKFYFRQKGENVMFLGGIFDEFEGGRCFTILTRDADKDMKPVHDRMPVIISHDKAKNWLDSLQDAKQMLYSPQPEIEHEPAQKEQPEYEQIHIFNTFDL